MRVLLIGPIPRLGAVDRLPWLAHTATALRRLGHSVICAPYRESWAASPALTRRAARLPLAAGTLRRFVAAVEVRRDRRLLTIARRTTAALTIVLKGEVFSPATLAAVKRAGSGPTVTWWVDSPFAFRGSLAQFQVLDHVFVFDRADVADLQAAGVARASFLPCACDETVYRPLRMSSGERRRLGSEVSFIASYDRQRAELVHALVSAGIDVGVWGTGWREIAAQSARADGTAVRGGVVSDRQAARIYNASQIGINLHHHQTRLAGVNARTFELLAAGTLPLTDWVAGMEELLEPGRDLVCYRSRDEAVELARLYLRDSTARATIVARGRARVLAEHTYVARLRTLCRVACE